MNQNKKKQIYYIHLNQNKKQTNYYIHLNQNKKKTNYSPNVIGLDNNKSKNEWHVQSTTDLPRLHALPIRQRTKPADKWQWQRWWRWWRRRWRIHSPDHNRALCRLDQALAAHPVRPAAANGRRLCRPPKAAAAAAAAAAAKQLRAPNAGANERDRRRRPAAAAAASGQSTWQLRVRAQVLLYAGQLGPDQVHHQLLLPASEWQCQRQQPKVNDSF